MRNIKMLGLLAISAMALVAFVGTSVASATSTFGAGEAGESLETSTLKPHVFNVTGTDVECETIEFSGKTEGTSTTSQIVTPNYEDCEAGGFEADVIENGCDYEFKAATSGSHATVKLFGCVTETKGIQISVSLPLFFDTTCLVDVPEQSIDGVISYQDTGNGVVDLKVTGGEIMADVTTSAGLCPLTTGTHSGENGGTYTGESSVTTPGGVSWTE